MATIALAVSILSLAISIYVAIQTHRRGIRLRALKRRVEMDQGVLG